MKTKEDVMTHERWTLANKRLLAKMVREFSYEDIIAPVLEKIEDRTKKMILTLDGNIQYRYRCEERMMDSIYVDENSIERFDGNIWVEATDAIQFLLDIQVTAKIKPDTAAYLIKEYNHTLLADVHILSQKENRHASDLIGMDYSELEGEMDGHPWITYNKGRIGFSYDDYLKYTPEMKQLTTIRWIAVHHDVATFHSISGLDQKQVIKHELSEAEITSFYEVLERKGVNQEDYMLLPIHIWQWNQMVIPLYSSFVSAKKIIDLGEGKDRYLPQQSVRTFVNKDHQHKYHVKLPMSILNTLVYRGLPSERTVIAPQITEFIKSIYDQDPFLRDQCRVILPGEVASINVNQPQFHDLPGTPYQFLEMLGVIWRESIYSYLDVDEQAVTLAALLYEDEYGSSYIGELIERSGLSAKEWVAQLFEVILPPLLHFLYKYGTVFSPHGQNTVIVLKNHRPHRLAVKDFVDDVNVSDQPIPYLDKLSEPLKKVLRSEPPEGLCQFIFTGLFVCHNRYLADLLERSGLLSESEFWLVIRETILSYQAKFPELKGRFELFDMLRPSFTKLCLNRNRMIDYGYEDGDDRPHASEHGKVNNPLYIVEQMKAKIK
ncbi:IucA/IucC family siderophore biosynthesis protein [Bacillus carboniphilus]|uniref:IucA/IucC family siderophore biosynthesis protein n=1 Tax=Bacillus carboniphilus TaxID=86663 RepID=A0ABY9JXB0_9BACI|nr:IucA/IucC family siderophore biosynthesis protein [Bacillus carboniphilus]WLR43138.1 IucA/IucC family siderophore biosynthesis protein [Bacillus carboniphilus]